MRKIYGHRLSDPKPLDRETVSTQSVSHLDPEGVVYASFVFLYRGERNVPFLLLFGEIANSAFAYCRPAEEDGTDQTTCAHPCRISLGSPQQIQETGFHGNDFCS